MKSVDVKQIRYIDSSKEINNEDPKFKIRDIVRISKYKNSFAKDNVPNWSEEFFVIKKVVKKHCAVILKVQNYVLNGKATIVLLTVGLIERT